LRIDVSRPVEFELALRKPAWADGFTLQGAGSWREENGWIRLRKTWHAGERIRLRFETQVRANPFREAETFLSYGPLVFALPLAGDEKVVRKYALEGFRDLHYFPISNPVPDWRLVEGQEFQLERGAANPGHPWETDLALTGSLLDATTQRVVPARLIPLGSSILRQVTFGSEKV
jgi:hypothetical protein